MIKVVGRKSNTTNENNRRRRRGYGDEIDDDESDQDLYYDDEDSESSSEVESLFNEEEKRRASVPQPMIEKVQHVSDDDKNTQTRGEFLLEVNKHVERVQNDLKVETNPAITRVSSGPGILCGAIVAAHGLAEKWEDCFVKVLFAEPGKDDNVMFRSKQQVHCTQVVELDADCAWDSRFEYNIYPPVVDEKSDWDSLVGDLVFTIYSSCGGRRNEFIGQVQLPLRALVDGTKQRIKGGEQTLKQEKFKLCDRSNSRAVQGELELDLQLLLPPDEPCTPPANSPKMKGRKAWGNATSSRGVKKKKKTSSSVFWKEAKESEAKLEEMGKYRAYRRSRARRVEQEKILRENERMQKRIGQAKKIGGIPAESTKLKRTERTKAFLKRTRGMKAGTNQEERVHCNAKMKMALCDQIHEKRQYISALEEELSQLKTTSIKLDAGLKRTNKVIEETRVLEERNWDSQRPNIERRRTTPVMKEKPSFGVAENLDKLRQRAMKALEAYEHEIRLKEEMERKIAQTREKHEALESTINGLREEIDRSKQKQTLSSRKLSVDEGTKLGLDKGASIQMLEEQLRELRIELKTIKSHFEDDRHHGELELNREKERVETYKSKLARKKQKIQDESKAIEEATKELDSDAIKREISGLRMKISRLR